jgi:branched-chain amino acid transport system ATP-binding protein
MLKVRDLHAYYGHIRALRGVSLDIQDGEFVTIIGNNGAGKTTLMMSISGLVTRISGTIEFQGILLNKLPPYRILECGLAHVPQGRMLFPDMTVLDNLNLGALRGARNQNLQERREEVCNYFPIIAERLRQKAGTLSGGEQQMLTIARALMVTPKLLMLDEPSSGLAPIVTQELARIIVKLNKGGITLLLVEQNARLALELADAAYILENGSLSQKEIAAKLLQSDEVEKAYLGIA